MMTTRVFLLMRGTLGLLTVAILNIVLVYINQEPTYLLTNVMKNIIYMGSKMLHEREEVNNNIGISVLLFFQRILRYMSFVI